MAAMRRCFGDGDRLYEAYHDEEWGRPLPEDLGPADRERALFERLSLEAFQSGLAWITVLRKRPAFREAFAGFDPAAVAAFGEEDVARLLADARIVRNRLKVTATIANARSLLTLHAAGGTLGGLLAGHTPARERPPADVTEVPPSTPESAALAGALRRAGFRFVGPTTVYATMQAVGIVNDHVPPCPLAGRPLAPAEAPRA